MLKNKIKTILFLDGGNISKHLLYQLQNNNKFQIKLIIISKENRKFFKFKKNNYKIIFSNLKNKSELSKISENFDIGFSYYNHKIPVEILKKMKLGGINFHPSYLPYNRSRHSAFWSIVDETPAGATSHWLNEKFDDGPIFYQERLKTKKFINGKELYYKQLFLLKKIINKTIKLISQKKYLRKNQNKKKISFHKEIDIQKKINFNLNDKIPNVDFIKILRGTTFNKNTGIFIFYKKKYFIYSEYKVIKNKNFKKKYFLNLNELFKNIKKGKSFYNKVFYKKFIFLIKSKVI